MRRVETFVCVSRQSEPGPRIVLARAGGGSRIAIDAVALVAQYAAPSGDILLVCDEDCPFEERLHLVLVRAGAVCDHVVIGAPYVGGVYRELAAEGATLRFRFEDGAVWRVTVGARGRRAGGRLPPRASRRSGWLAPRYLAIERDAEA